MLLLIAAAVGFGLLSGATTTLPWMVVLTLVVGGVTGLLALASGSSWLAVLGFAFCAGAGFQLSYVVAAVLQEAVASRTARRNAAPAVQG
jgi:hypothetical protein